MSSKSRRGKAQPGFRTGHETGGATGKCKFIKAKIRLDAINNPKEDKKNG